MVFIQLFAAFFYLQPSLIITFVPVQIVVLFLCLWLIKKISIFKALLHAFAATFFASLVIFLLGSIVVPFLHVNFFQLLSISFGYSFFLLFMTAVVYWMLLYFYLSYLLKIRIIAQLSGISSAIAGLSVLVLYCLWWR